MDYTNCVRTEKGYCAIEWKEKTGATPGYYDDHDDYDHDHDDHDHDYHHVQDYLDYDEIK